MQNIVDECEQLLCDIADLRDQLETTYDEEQRKRINRTIDSKEMRYNELACGAIDPSRKDDTKAG